MPTLAEHPLKGTGPPTRGARTRRGSMPAGRAVFVLGLGLDLDRVPKKKSARLDPDVFRPLDQRRGDQDFHAIAIHDLIAAGDVFPLEVGVDRHLGPAASAQGRDKVQRGDPAFMADSIQGLFGNLDLHS